MRNSVEILEKLLEKIKNTPDDIIEQAIDSLSEKIAMEDYTYNFETKYKNVDADNNFDIERENGEWKIENLQSVA